MSAHRLRSRFAAIALILAAALSFASCGDGPVAPRPNAQLVPDTIGRVEFRLGPGGAGAPQRVTLTPAAAKRAGSLVATVIYDDGMPKGWLDAAVVTGGGGPELVLTPDVAGLPQGTYTGYVRLTSTRAGMRAEAVCVRLEVNAIYGGGAVVAVAVTPDPANVLVGQTVRLTAVPKDGAGQPLTGHAVTWRSGDVTIATVDQTGLVTGVAAGAVFIFATSDGVSGDSRVFVSGSVVTGFTRTWLGGAAGSPTSWFTAANWSPAAVPTASDVVLIPATANQPVSGAPAAVAAIAVAAGARLDLGGSTLDVSGAVDASGPIANGTVRLTGTAPWRGTLPNVEMSGTATLAGDATLTGSLLLTGDLGLGGHTLAIGGALTLQTFRGLLHMTDPAERVTVAGSATFAGGDVGGEMRAGVLEVAGDFTQQSSSGGQQHNFAPTGSHLTRLVGPARPTVTFGNPGLSLFNDLTITSPAGALQASDVVVARDFTLATPSALATASPAVALTVGRQFTAASGSDLSALGTLALTGSGAVFPLAGSTAPARTVLDGDVTLTADRSWPGDLTVRGDLALAGHALTVRGSLDVRTFRGLIHMTIPADRLVVLGKAVFGGGDVGGEMRDGVLEVSGDFAQETSSGGHQHNFLPTGSHRTRFVGAGVQTVSFQNPGPSAFNDLEVANGGGLAVATPVFVSRDFTVSTAVPVNRLGANPATAWTVGGLVTTVAGSDLRGIANLTLTGSGAIFPVILGTSIQGTVFMTGTVTAQADLTLMSPLQVTGDLRLGGHTVTVLTLWVFGSNGILRMTNPADRLVSLSSVIFEGTDVGNEMRDGVLEIGGNFLEQGGPGGHTANFAPTGNHLTIFSGTGGQIITMGNTSTSFFNDLRVTSPLLATIANTGTAVRRDLDVVGHLRVSPGRLVPVGRTLFLRSASILDNFGTITPNACVREPGATVNGTVPAGC